MDARRLCGGEVVFNTIYHVLRDVSGTGHVEAQCTEKYLGLPTAFAVGDDCRRNSRALQVCHES